MKKCNIVLSVFILMALALTGCRSAEDIQRERQIKQYAKGCSKEICETYIKEKYGFDAEFQEYDLEYADSLFLSYLTGDVYCRMKYENKYFYVIYETDSPAVITDNYQKEEIIKAIEDVLELGEQGKINLYPNAYRPFRYYQHQGFPDDGYFSQTQEYFNCCINERYNGNIKDFLNTIDASIIMEIQTYHPINKNLLFETFKNLSYEIRIETLTTNILDPESRYAGKVTTEDYWNISEFRERIVEYTTHTPIEGYTFLYNGINAFEDTIQLSDSSNIDIPGYEVVSPLFIGIGNTQIEYSNSRMAEIKVEDYEGLYYMQYRDALDLNKIYPAQSHVLMGYQNKIVFLKPIQNKENETIEN